MTRVATLLFLFALVFGPASARADDGGWLDWLYRMDPKFVGVGTELHLVCLDKENAALPISKCDNWFRNVARVLAGRRPENMIDLENIRHEFDLRLAFYWKYGSTFSDVIDNRSAYAVKVMGMYHYHINNSWQYGGGAGVIPFKGEMSDWFTRPIITPVSVVWAPAKSSVVTLRFEYSYIGGGLSGRDFGNLVTSFEKNGEHNVSFAVGYDLRRLPVFKKP